MEDLIETLRFHICPNATTVFFL